MQLRHARGCHMVFWKPIQPLQRVPRLACSVASLSWYPGHQLLKCYSLHCKTLAGYLLGKELPSAYTVTHSMQHCIPAPQVTAEPEGSQRPHSRFQDIGQHSPSDSTMHFLWLPRTRLLQMVMFFTHSFSGALGAGYFSWSDLPFDFDSLASPAIPHFTCCLCAFNDGEACHGTCRAAMSMQTHEQTHIGMHCISCSQAILAEGAIALPVTLSGGALFASWKLLQFLSRLIVKVIRVIFMRASAQRTFQDALLMMLKARLFRNAWCCFCNAWCCLSMHLLLTLLHMYHLQQVSQKLWLVLLLGACCVSPLHVALVSSTADCGCDRMLPPSWWKHMHWLW